MAPALTASSCCCGAVRSLAEVLNTISDRMSDGSSGGVLDRSNSGLRSGPMTATRVNTPLISRVTFT